jgi:hypothetical protein
VLIKDFKILYNRKVPLRVEAQPGGYVIAPLPDLTPNIRYLLQFWCYSYEDNRPIELAVSDKENNFLPAKEYLLPGKKYALTRYTIPADRASPGMKVFVGWDPQNPHQLTNSPFWIVAEPPRAMGAIKHEWVQQGLCPRCGENGSWKPPATLWCEKCNRAYAGC